MFHHKSEWLHSIKNLESYKLFRIMINDLKDPRKWLEPPIFTRNEKMTDSHLAGFKLTTLKVNLH